MSTTLAAPQTTTTTWNLDAVHSVAEFKVKHMIISNVKGQFTGVTGVLTLDDNDITGSRVEAISMRQRSTLASRSATHTHLSTALPSPEHVRGRAQGIVTEQSP